MINRSSNTCSHLSLKLIWAPTRKPTRLVFAPQA